MTTLSLREWGKYLAKLAGTHSNEWVRKFHFAYEHQKMAVSTGFSKSFGFDQQSIGLLKKNIL